MAIILSSSDTASFSSVMICCTSVATLSILSRVTAVVRVARTGRP
jgi:hypothetical protein